MAIITPDEITTLADPDEQVEADVKAEKIAAPLKVVIGSSFLLRIAGAATAILLASFLRQNFDAQADLIGILAALFYVTELLLAPVFGAISDIRGRRWLLVMGPLVGAIALPIYPFSALAATSIMGVAILAMARLLEGIATAAKVPSALGYLADATAGEGKPRAALRGRVMGLYEMSFLVGLGVGNVLGGNLWAPLQESAFYIVAGIYLLTAIILFFFVPESLPQEAREHNASMRASATDAMHPVVAVLKERLRTYASLVREPALSSFVPAWLAVNSVVGLFSTLVQPIMMRGRVNHFPEQVLNGHFEPHQVSYFFVGFGLIFMVGIWVWSLLYTRIRKSTVMLIAAGGLFLVCLALVGINNRLPFQTGWNIYIWAPLLVAGLFLVSGFTPVALAYLAEISGTKVEHRGAVMGLYSVFLALGQLIGSGVGGVFITWFNRGFNGLILATFLLGVIALVTVLRLRQRQGI